MATFTVTNLNDSGTGSLRAAIAGANATSPGSPNTITFDPSIAGGTITLASVLPSITNPTSIIASSATAGSAPTVEIDFNGHAGLTFDGGSQGSQLIGLALGGASGAGVTLNAGNILLNNNYIGLALDGSALGNIGDGVFVAATSSGNQIGANPDALSRVVTNVISNNGGNGIAFHGSSDNVVESNRIGTNVAGTAAMANGANGIWVTAGSNGNTIGGTAFTDSSTGQQNDPTGDKGTTTATIVTPPLGNLVSGNGEDGIRIDNASQNNVLSGNFVGTDVTGNTALGNIGDGVDIEGADNNSLIGCTFADNPFVYYNVVSGNGANGVHVTNANGTVIQANFVGVGANNAVTVGNANDGILVDGSSANTQVGGVIPLGNVISGNAVNGIEVKDTASGFTTFNTFAGVFAFGGAAPNGNDGVLITSTGGNQIVRTNVISGNLNNGLEIGGDASGVTVVPNIIGLDTRGDTVIANGGNGVLITGTAHDNMIGGAGGDQVSVIRQNTFSGNVGYGVEIAGQAYNNVVTDSAIGTDIQEIGALPNGAGGVLLSSTGQGNVIGSPSVSFTPSPSPATLVNIISGNDGNGVTLGAGAAGDAVINNWIGLDITGAATLPNSGVPIQTNSSYNLVAGNVATGALPTESVTAQLEALYIGWFGWAADPASFSTRMQTLLTDVLQGSSVSAAAVALSQDFSTAPQESVYAPLASLVTPVASPTPGQIALADSFIDQTYTNLFGHAADAADKLAWRTALFDGTVSFSAMVPAIANAATGSDSTALNSRIEAAAYFTSALTGSLLDPPSQAEMQAAISGVVDATSELASQAGSDALVSSSHQQIDFSSILGTGSITTGVRAGLNGTVVLTGSQPVGSGTATEAYIYEGPLNNTAAGTKYILTPTFSGETITTATLYGPDTSIFDPALGVGNIRAVGSYQYAESPSGTFNHGMMYQGPVTGIGGTWTQIDVPADGTNVVGGTVLGGQVEDTILHSTQGDLIVGNYDMAGPGGTLLGANGFIYDIATHQYTLLSINGSIDNLTSVYGIWQNGIGSTSYTITGGTYVAADGINEAFLEDYDSSTGTFSNLRFYTGFNQPGVITHFENITAVPGGYNLVATTDSGPAFANVTRNADGSFGSATWVAANLPGTSMMTGNIAFQNVIGGIYNTSGSGATPTTYLGVVDLSHVDAAGGLIMPMGSFDFAYALTVNGSVGDTISGSSVAGNVLGGSIGNDIFIGTQAPTQADTIFTGGGADTITLAASHAASDRIELYAGNSLANAASLVGGGIVASVSGSIVDAADIPQLGWWGQATAQSGGPASNATTNAGLGTGTSQDMSTVANFAAGSDTIDISLTAFSDLLRDLGNGSAPAQGTAVFSNLVHPGGTITVANANVLLISSPTGFLDAADVAATLVATPITFAGTQTNPVSHYIIAYQDLGGNVRLADMDIHASGAFTRTSQAETLSISDMVQLTGVSLASLQPGDITFLDGSSTSVVTSGQTLIVSAGQTASGIVVLSGGGLYVLSGGSESSGSILGGGLEVVSSGGTASGTMVSGDFATEWVSSGGVASGAILSAGRQFVYAGGSALGTIDRSGGDLEVYGGTVSGATVSSGGALYVSSGGLASGTVVSAGGGLTVSSGGTARSGSVLSGGLEVVSAGGTASGTVVSGDFATEWVSSGGVASGTVLSAGRQFVYAGGSALGTIEKAGGDLEVYGGTVSDAAVSSGGALYMSSGGTASGTVVSDGGGLVVSSGGTAISGSVLSGGLEVVSAGGVASGTVVSGDFATEWVSSGGVASGTVLSAGRQFVYAGGSALGTIDRSGGDLEVYGGTVSGATVSSGGGLYVSSGGVASGTVVSAGGGLVVSSGGTAISGSVLSGGLEVVSAGGVASGTVVSGDFATEWVSSGGVASGTVLSAGRQFVYAGGSALGTIDKVGGDIEVYGGTVSGATVSSGGALYVSSGGLASGTVVSAGGGLVVSSGGTAISGSVLSGGLEVVSAGGVASGTVVSGDFATEWVSSGGVASGTVLSAGRQFVYAGGSAVGTIDKVGGDLEVYGGTVSGATVSSGGALYVSSGGLASGTIVSNGGGLVVSLGGTARSGSVLSGGLEVVLAGGTASGTVMSGDFATEWVSSGGVASGTVLSAGRQFVYAGGSAVGTIDKVGGDLEVYGGAVIGATVSSGGALYVSSGGTSVSATILSGGAEYVSSGGTISGATLSAGFLEIQSGGTAGTSQINFTSAGGLLELDDSSSFNAVISGFGVPGGIDLTDINFATATLGYSGDASSGVLTVGDGLHAAAIHLLGQYVQGNFHLSDDGFGKTLVTDPPVVDLAGSPYLAPSHG